MINILFWQSVKRILSGLLLALILLLVLPSFPVWRFWCGTLLGLACPLLVLGRRQALNARVYSILLSTLPRPRRWQLLSLTPAFFVILLFALIIAQGSMKLTLTFFMWGVCCVSISDLFDHHYRALGQAWTLSLMSITTLISAPFWGAIWFGSTPLAPWLATVVFGTHPTFSGLQALGVVTLQAPVMYDLTQSGLVEVHPLPWWSGACLYGVITLFCVEYMVRTRLHDTQP